MSAVQGKKKEIQNYSKKVGLFEGQVIAVNPTREQLENIYQTQLEKDPEYLGEDKDGNITLRLEFHLRDVKTKGIFKTSFFLVNKERLNKDETKKQYINTLGNTSWVDNPKNLKDWFTKRDYRVARVGEEELYNFVKSWLPLDYKQDETLLNFDWKKLMKGNVKEFSDLIGSDLEGTILSIAIVRIVNTKDENGNESTREYQQVYNRAFLPGSAIKTIRLKKLDQKYIDYCNHLEPNKRKLLDKFVLQITDPEYGIKDFYGGLPLTELRDYDPSENFVASDKVISDEDSDY